MLKAYKYRIYPNTEQENRFNQHFGCARWVYNWALNRKQEHYKKTKKSKSKRELQDELVHLKKTEDYKWLNDVNSQTLLSSLLHLHTAFTNFFHKRAKFPKFKKKYSARQKYQCPQHVVIDFENELIHLPKIKNVKAKLHRNFSGKIKTCTIERTVTNKYFVSVLVETLAKEPIKSTAEPELTIGIDLGVKELLTTNEGLQVQNYKYLQKGEKKLKKLQRRLSKKENKSANRGKARRLLAKAHERIANQRLNLLHQISSHLVYKNQATSIAIEDLHVKGMMKNHKLSKAIGDCSWGMLLRQLEYKTNWSGKNLIKIDRWFPSSKTCSNCGTVKDELSLSERVYCCATCSIKIDRDVNAAINIKNVALQQIGLECPESKLVDHALTGVGLSNLVIHGMKQEAATRA